MDKKFFFDRYGLAQADVERYLSAALSAGGDFADLYFEYQTSTSVSLDESMVKSATQGISVGCGVRVLSGERTGYAYTDDLSPERLLHAARTAALIASGPAKQPVVGLTNKPAHNLYPVPLPSVEAEVLAKVDLVQRADKAARAYDPRIHEVRVSYADELRRILVIGSDGSFRRGCPAHGAHERLLHRQGRDCGLGARHGRRRRPRGAGLFPRRRLA